MSSDITNLKGIRSVPLFLQVGSNQLIKSGRTQQLHASLAKETAEGCNDLYQLAKINFTEGKFIGWIDNAWKCVDMTIKEPSNFIERRNLGLQFRYMLMTASATSEVSNAPSTALKMLAERGSRIQGFEAIRQMASEKERLAALTHFLESMSTQLDSLRAQNLSEEHLSVWRELWKTLQSFHNDLYQAEALKQMVRYAPDEEIPNILEYILRDIVTYAGASSSPLQIAFSGIAPLLSEEQLSEAYNQIIFVKLYPTDGFHDLVLIDLIVNFIRVGDPFFALVLVRKIDKRQNIALAVTKIADMLDPFNRSSLFGYAWEAIPATDVDLHITTKIDISAVLTDAEIETLLDQISEIANLEYRIDFLMRIVPKLAGDARTRSLALFSAACRALRKVIRSERKLADKTIALLPALTQADLRELLDILAEMTDQGEIERIVKAMQTQFENEATQLSESEFDEELEELATPLSNDSNGSNDSNDSTTTDREDARYRYPPQLDDAMYWIMGICEATLCLPSSVISEKLFVTVLEATRQNLENGDYPYFVEKLLIVLVKLGSIPTVLELLQQINSEDHSTILSNVLICIAQQGSILQAFAGALKIMNVEQRIRTLIKLAAIAPDSYRNEIVQVSLQQIESKFMGDKLSLHALLLNTLPDLDSEVRHTIANQVTSELTTETITSEIWKFLADNTPDFFQSLLSQEINQIFHIPVYDHEQMARLRKIVDFLPSEMLIRTCQLVKYSSYNSALLPIYVQRLIDLGYLEESLQLALATNEYELRILCLYPIFNRLSPKQQEQAKAAIQNAAKEITRNKGIHYAIALAQAGEILEDPTLYTASLNTCKTWFKEEYFETLIKVAPHLSLEMREESLDKALAMLVDLPQSQFLRFKPMMDLLLSALLDLPRETIYDLWMRSLHTIAARPRKDILPYIGLWIRIAAHLSHEDVAKDIFCAIQDVGRWWVPISSRSSGIAQDAIQSVLAERYYSKWLAS